MSDPKHKVRSRYPVFWQIWFPILITSLLFLVFSIAIILSAKSYQAEIHTGANVSLSFLAFIGSFLGLLWLALLIFSINTLNSVSKKAPHFFNKTQEIIGKVSSIILFTSRLLRSPFNLIRSIRTQFKSGKKI